LHKIKNEKIKEVPSLFVCVQ